jgi:sterol desaturase/sphingolipid hydroxylase (fatty acid hydroxylase superfamily)
MPSRSIVAALTALFVLLFVLEQIFPLRKRTLRLWRRLVLNLTISAIAFASAAVLVKPVGSWLLRWSSEKPFGLLQWVDLPKPASFACGFLLMDLSFYYWHLANHKLPLLWRFHNVHHIDEDLDVSTAFRFHFGEIAFSAIFRMVQVVALGVSVWTYAIYELVFQANTMVHHSNVRLPLGLERVLNKVLVTPRMHGIHHSQVEAETNSNFSTVFSWWDRLHRSLDLSIPQSEIVIGVPGYSGENRKGLWSCLLLPFRKQRDYWRRPDGTRVVRDRESIENVMRDA